MTVNEHMRSGHFGPVLRRGHVHYVSLDAVQRHYGQQFTPSQVEAAIDGKPGRALTIAAELEEAA